MEIDRVMAQKPLLTLLISSTETLQDGLLALFTTIPQIGAVLVAEDKDIGLRMIENHMPKLVIIDMALPGSHDMMKQIKANWASLHLMALVEDTTQQRVVRSLGADSVLVKGFSAAMFLSIVESQIEHPGGLSPRPDKDR